MAIKNYAILMGQPLEAKIFQPRSQHDQPHLHIKVLGAGGAFYDIAVNIQSNDGSEVAECVRQKGTWTPPNAAKLQTIKSALTHPDHNDGFSLDFVRMPGLVTRDEMRLLPIDETSPTSAHHSDIEALVQDAIAKKATIFAFGQTFLNGTSSASPFWGFKPDQGIHDIHMNQGNPNGPHSRDNGTFQDGALFFLFSDGTWAAAFIAFQSQSFKTDENGNQA